MSVGGREGRAVGASRRRGRRPGRSRATTPRWPPRCATSPARGSDSGPTRRPISPGPSASTRVTATGEGHARARRSTPCGSPPTTATLFAVNMVVVGTAPDRTGWFTGAPDLRVEVDGRVVHDGPATTVVVASGQYLRGHDVVPRGHPGDGRAEVQVYAVPRGQRAGVRSRLPQGVHLPHPDITQTTGRRVDVVAGQAAPVGLEVDGVPGPAGDPGHRRGRPRGVPDRRLNSGDAVPVASGVAPIPSPARTVTSGRVGVGRVGGETVGVYPSENFTDDEAAVLRPYFTNLDRPVFALVNLPEVVKGALFAALLAHAQEPASPLPRRVRQRPRPHRRPHRRRHRRPQARRGALRPRVPRVRRRLRRAARRRAPRVRAGVEPAHQDPRVGPAHGVPRAVDALHRVRPEARRSLPLLPRPRRARLARARVALHRRHGRAVHHVRRDAAAAHRRGRASATRRNRATPTSSTSRRSRRRRATRSAASCPRRRCRTSASTAPARATKRCCCACARTRCPRRAATRR